MVVGGGGVYAIYEFNIHASIERCSYIKWKKEQGAENFVYYTIFYLKGKIGLYLLIFKNSGKENKNF